MPAGVVYDENIRAFWLDTDPADLDAPTVAEIGAGTDISGYLVPDGLAFNIGNSRVSGADLLSAFDNESMGRHQAAPSLTLKRRLRGAGSPEVAWDTLGTRGVEGCLVVFPFLGSASVAASEPCYVFPSAETGSPILQNTAANAEQQFVVDLAIGAEPQYDGVVAA